METKPSHPPSQLFTLRVWKEELGEGVTEWRGQLRHVTTGEVHYFRDWQALIALLPALLAELEPRHQET